MIPRDIASCAAVLGLLLSTGPVSAGHDTARGGVSPAVRGWLSAFITRIEEADRARRTTAAGKTAGTVVVRVEVAADGSVRRRAIEHGSGSRALDRRALDALAAVSPITPPPAELLTAAGVTDLSFPLQLRR